MSHRSQCWVALTSSLIFVTVGCNNVLYWYCLVLRLLNTVCVWCHLIYTPLFWMRICSSNYLHIFKANSCSHCELCLASAMNRSMTKPWSMTVRWIQTPEITTSDWFWSNMKNLSQYEKKSPSFSLLCTFSHSLPIGVIKFNLISFRSGTHMSLIPFLAVSWSLRLLFSSVSLSDILPLICPPRSSSQRC